MMEINVTKDYLFLRRKSNLLKINLTSLELEVEEIDLNNQQSARYKELTEELKTSHYNMETYGVFGLVRLINHHYLIVIKHAKLIGQILTADIYRVDKLKFIPLNNKSSKNPTS